MEVGRCRTPLASVNQEIPEGRHSLIKHPRSGKNHAEGQLASVCERQRFDQAA
jgi:hypothetical protein